MRSLGRTLKAVRGKDRDRESGTTAIEFVFWTPLLLGLILLAVQVAIYLFAEHVAQTAAQAGARVARQESATNGNWLPDAQQAVDSWVGNLIGNGASPPVVTPIGPTVVDGVCPPPNVGVQVSFTMASILGGLNVTATNEGPVEQFYPPGC